MGGATVVGGAVVAGRVVVESRRVVVGREVVVAGRVVVVSRVVGVVAGRVVADAREIRDPFDGLERIGIDEISYRRGHKYLMVVVDHDTGRLVWAKAGHDRATLQEFFDLLGAERASRIRLISADAAEWIGDCALTACENATLCQDPFHIVRWASQVNRTGIGVCS